MNISNITIISKTECPYCIKAKLFLDNINIKFDTISLEPSDEKYIEMRDFYFNKYNHKSFPLIFIGETFIGGYKELEKSYETLRFHDLCSKIGINVNYDF